jgi:hypothetical protein
LIFWGFLKPDELYPPYHYLGIGKIDGWFLNQGLSNGDL